MALTPGEIYFVREADYLTKKLTPYVKIGLVREAEFRDSTNRILEHQTGNPRTLSAPDVVKTAMVERIETLLHGLFATSRIEGEWFYLEDDRLADAIKTAQTFAAEADAAYPFFERAEALKDNLASEDALPATDELKALHAEWLIADASTAELTKTEKRVREAFREAFEQNEPVAGAARAVAVKGAKRFDEPGFKAKYPEIYAEFLETISKQTGSFLPTRAKGNEDIAQYLADKVQPLIAEIDAVFVAIEAGTKAKADLNGPYLVVLETLALAEWNKDVAEMKLRVACGIHKGIEGICKWDRIMKETEKLDKPGLTVAHPDLVAEFTVETEGRQAVHVAPRIAAGESVD